ncbi:MAG TPA: MarR family transcriptional regulator [Solirubrobacterales bacterium]|nr:MarR family transcriptional regulator [Solirubrobacterales bacterium]
MSEEAISERASAASAVAAPPRTTQTTPHGEAWGALTRTHAAVTQRLQEALAQGDYPPLPWYEVLSTVAEAPEQRMRMGDLAEVLVITRGGLTKLVDRLVKAGLIERTFCESDRRVSYATLLPAGRDLLAEMRPVVVGELEVAFSANLSEAEAGRLTETLDRVRGSACEIGSA